MGNIPASQFVSVIPGVLSAGSPPLSMAGLLVTEDTSIPLGTVQSFASAQAVSDWFGADSNQAYLAGIYFQGYVGCTQLPGQILFTQYNSAAAAAYLRGGSMASVALATLQGYSGTISISINGANYTTGSINLSSATSFSNAATLIQAAFTTASIPATVTFDSLRSGFLITSNTTGTGSSVDFPTDSSLSPDLLLTQADGAVLSPGAAAQTPAGLMDAVEAITTNWAAFSTDWLPTLTVMEAFASWVTAQNSKYLYCPYDNAQGAFTPSNSAVLGYITSQYTGVYCLWNPAGDKAAFALGTIASINFNQPGGRITFAYRQSPAGLAADVTSQTDYQALLTNSYDAYVSVGSGASNFTFLQNGHVSGKWDWLDSYVNQIYFNSAFQGAGLTLFQNSNSIPFNAAGQSLISGAMQPVINQMLAFGAAVAGGTLTAAQQSQINSATGSTNAAAAVMSNGYFQSVPIPDPDVQQARGPWPVTLFYFDGESVQTLTMASVDVE